MRRSVDFERAVRRGVRAGGSTLVVHVAGEPSVDSGGVPSGTHRSVNMSSDDAGPRVGFVVSKAVGNSVHRNLVKRRLRAATAESMDMLPRDSYVVVRALPSAAQADYAQLEADLRSGFRRAVRRWGTR